MVRKIAITGPESSGKSSLAIALANHFNCDWVPEYAREYLNNLGRPYKYEDLLIIAMEQVRLEHEKLDCTKRFLFCDTELTVIKIWCEFKYGKVHPWIKDNHEKQNHDLYLLMDIDLPWQPDPFREHPNKRKELFDLYLGELQRRKWPFEIISGRGDQRINQAIQILTR